LPVGFTEDIFEALDIQDELQTLYTSGTVFHAFLGEKLPDWRSAAALVRKIAENYSLPYYTLSPTYSVCRNHGYITGEVYECPQCHEKTEVYSRITGYYRPVQNWNDGKAAEFKERKTYNLDTAMSKEFDAKSNKNDEKCGCCEKPLLVTTKTCPNCRVAVTMLDKAGISYEKIVAEDSPETAKKYGITQAPTLVSICGNEIRKFVGVSGVKEFISLK
jgi:ribonucleoside-triphosphate reductase